MNAFLTIKSIEHCVRHIHSWMLNDYPKLNNNETEYLIIRTPQKGENWIPVSARAVNSNIKTMPIASSKIFASGVIPSCLSQHSHKYMQLFISHNNQQPTEVLIGAFMTTGIGWCNNYMNVSAVFLYLNCSG